MSAFEVCGHEIDAPALPDEPPVPGEETEIVTHWCNSDPDHSGQHHCCCGFRWTEEVPC